MINEDKNSGSDGAIGNDQGVKVYSKPFAEPVLGSVTEVLAHIAPDFEAGTVERVNVVDQLEASPYVLLLEEKISERGSRRAIVTYLLENKKIKTVWIERVENSVNRIPADSINGLNRCGALLGP